MRDKLEVIEYQAIQNKKGELELLIVPSKEYTAEIEERIIKDFKNKFEISKFQITKVNKIPRTKAGKLKAFISNS